MRDKFPFELSPEEVDAKDMQAYVFSLRPIPEIGKHVVHYVSDARLSRVVGVSEARALRAWREGTRQPGEQAEFRYRISARIIHLLDNPICSWLPRDFLFQPNPLLNQRLPASIIRNYEYEESGESDLVAVINAAKTLITFEQQFLEPDNELR